MRIVSGLEVTLRLPDTAHVTNISVRSQTDQPPVSSLIQQRRLKLFGHIIARAAASEDHSRALRASTDRLPVDWRRPRGRSRQSWLRTIDSDLKPLNLGLHSALRRASDRPSWRRIVETALRACHQMMMTMK